MASCVPVPVRAACVLVSGKILGTLGVRNTYLIRPPMMNCDPPTIACSDCVTSGAVALIGTADFQWDNQCDRCGAHDTLLTPTMLRLGHMTISAHVLQTLCR